MKNKLLLSSALVGSLIASSIASAETKITGSMDLSYTAISKQSAAASDSGFGRETQINVSNSGELSNGMAYSAGFSLEMDGGGTAKNNENVYIDLKAGDVTLSLGVDHISNMDSSAVPRVSAPANSIAVSSKDLSYNQGASFFTAGNTDQTHAKESMGIGASAAGFVFYYVPQLGDVGGGNDSFTAGPGGSAYQIMYKGNAGVEGLNINAGMQGAEKALGSTYTAVRDVDNTQISASYNFGQFTVGAGKIDSENGSSTAASDRETVDYGITYAVNDQLSIGINYAETELTGQANDEEVTMVQVGYNLGAIGVVLSYVDIQNVENQASTDDQIGSIRIATKF
jgi:outer membrane protein OmpU